MISNKDKLKDKDQKIVARLPLEHMTIKTHYAYAKWLRFLIDATYKAKVLATQQPLSNQVLNDLSELIDNTSYASQIAPRSKVDNQYMQIVEEAIKGYTKIRFKYRSANAENRLYKRYLQSD